MPVEMRIGRPLFLEINWLFFDEQSRGGGGDGVAEVIVRYSVRRVFAKNGDYMGSAFASFAK
jgi:hypothetical protein